MLELVNGIKSVVENCMYIKPKERVMIVTDNEAWPMLAGQLTMDVINSMGAEAFLTIITPRQITAKEPPSAVAITMKNVDVILEISDKFPMVHTTARKEATAAGARHYVMHQLAMEDLQKGALAEDIQLIKKRTEGLAKKMEQAKIARLTSAGGTDITMSLAGRKGVMIHPAGGVGSGLPYYAEAAITPVEGTAEGKVVADLAIPQWKYLFKEPLRYTAKAGRIVDVSGDAQDVERFRQLIATDENANNIAELGVGTSHTIPSIMRGIRADCGRIGTAHIGIGRNNDIGGNTLSALHIDTLMSQATLELDGKPVLKDGKLLI